MAEKYVKNTTREEEESRRRSLSQEQGSLRGRSLSREPGPLRRRSFSQEQGSLRGRSLSREPGRSRRRSLSEEPTEPALVRGVRYGRLCRGEANCRVFYKKEQISRENAVEGKFRCSSGRKRRKTHYD